VSRDLYTDGAGVAISTYAGPDVPEEPRTRVQIAVVDTDNGGWQTLHMTLTQWAALCDGIRQIGDTPR